MPVILVRCRLRQATLRGRRLERLAQQILRATGNPRAHLSLELISDRRMRRLNRHYRGVDRPTDVLSFPTYRLGVRGKGLGVVTPYSSPLTPYRFLGDVVISVPMARRQAAADRQTMDQALVRLLIHGILHLEGYDHERPREARRMQAKELAVLRALGPIPNLLRKVKGKG
jgi:probable rRNA maturation factor